MSNKTPVHMTAAKLIEIAANPSYASTSNIHRLVGEVFRLRAKVRGLEERLAHARRCAGPVRDGMAVVAGDEGDAA